jgi:hypothetical protein
MRDLHDLRRRRIDLFNDHQGARLQIGQLDRLDCDQSPAQLHNRGQRCLKLILDSRALGRQEAPADLTERQAVLGQHAQLGYRASCCNIIALALRRVAPSRLSPRDDNIDVG